MKFFLLKNSKEFDLSPWGKISDFVKEDASTVRAGTECGVKLNGFDDVKTGDQLVFYNRVQVKRTLG